MPEASAKSPVPVAASSKVAIKLYGREYQVNCGPGEESRLEEIVRFVESRMGEIADRVGNTTEPRLLMLTCLLLADELMEGKRMAAQNTIDNEDLLVAAVTHLQERVAQIAAQVGTA
jgi:cell division protein ZapA